MTTREIFFACGFLGWSAVVVALFRAIGPARAVVVAVLGALLAMPTEVAHLPVFGLTLPFDKRTSTGLALLVGLVLFARERLISWRPAWYDLPMLAYLAEPILHLGPFAPGSSADVVDLLAQRILGWGSPYLAGRVLLADGEGTRLVLSGVAISGLCYLPVVLFESLVGPENYLATRLFRTPIWVEQANRLGGWRPQGMFANGLELALWMSLAAVAGAWVALSGRRLIPRIPAWLPAVVLVAGAIACRGVFGYLTLTAGLVAAVATRYLKTRAVLVALLMLPPLYVGARLSGQWDGRVLLRGASAISERSGTLAYRLDAEDEVLARLGRPQLAMGKGEYIWNAKNLSHWPDGAWLHQIWFGGMLGLAAYWLATCGWPAGFCLSRDPGGPGRVPVGSGLALLLALVALDGLFNVSILPPMAVVVGSLVGVSGRFRILGGGRAGDQVIKVGLIAFVLVAEILGLIWPPG
jgi:hypothetical protein